VFIDTDQAPWIVNWAGVAVPIFLIPATSTVRSLVKKNSFWTPSNWWLGIDLCFASIAAIGVQFCDRVRAGKLDDPYPIICTLSLGFAYAVGLLVVMKMHQDMDCDYVPARLGPPNKAEMARRKRHKRKQFWILTIASNLVGAGTIAVFAYMRAKGSI
jgi:hypothetical protein